MKPTARLLPLVLLTILPWGLPQPLLAQVLEQPKAAGGQNRPAELDRCNVVFDSPSRDAAGAMPIGNGEVGLNVWVEEGGDLLFYVARTDAWSECCRLLKLGRVRVRLEPNPFAKGRPFRQELKLRDGRIDIKADDAELRVFVDAAALVVYVTCDSKTPRTVTASFETWRTEKLLLNNRQNELASSWTLRGIPDNVEAWESADVVAGDSPASVLAYHRNDGSIFPLTLKHQGLEKVADAVGDPLMHRTFGGRLAAAGFKRQGTNAIRSETRVTRFAVTLATHTAQTKAVEQWRKQMPVPADAAAASSRTAQWWHEFWNRSWILVGGQTKDPVAQVTRAYALQRWMTACAGRGSFPIKFNGSLFTVDPVLGFDVKTDPRYGKFSRWQFAGGGKRQWWAGLSPDWRYWGDCYWWQNTRLPYFAMAACGDYDLMQPVFRFYRDALPLCRSRAKLYFGADGAYFPETMTIFGAYSNGDYGWRRDRLPLDKVTNDCIAYIWQPGLELVAMMLDYYDNTQNAAFLRDQVIPTAHEVLRYYDTRFPRDAKGRLVISPTQAVETYRKNVVNDTPSVAGLHCVISRLLALPGGPAAERDFWLRMKAATPPLPMRDNAVDVAEAYSPQRGGEDPELYAIWPYRLYGVGRPDLAVGVKTFHGRKSGFKNPSKGWYYDGPCAALLGLTKDARQILLDRIGNTHPAYRFPATWGPNADWVPDQDHGSNIMLTMQHMLMEDVGGKILLLPAWPKDWDVSFKLHATKRTTVECEVCNGKVTKLTVTPESRRKDVEICKP